MPQQRESDITRKKKKKRNRKRRKKAISSSGALKAMIVVLLFSIGVATALGFITYNKHLEKQTVQAMSDVVEKDAIYEHIFINGLDVGGMSKEQAVLALKSAQQKSLEEQKLRFLHNSGEYVYPLSDFKAMYDIEAAVEVAYDYARTGSLLERFTKINELSIEPCEITALYSYDEGLLKAAIADVAEKVYIAPTDAVITRVSGVFQITNETPGRSVLVEETSARAVALLDAGKGGDVEIAFAELKPQFTAMDLNNAKDLIGGFSTTFQPGENGRNTNIKTAVSKINGVVVYPGEIFSTNKEFGPSTEANGYLPAPIIVGGKLKDDIGGGVCQVSSTLYNAILYAELEVVERQNHSLKVSYTDYGYDATLAGDYIDLKFKNNTLFPVIVESYIENNNRVVVNIYGHEVHNPGRELVFQNALVETVPPPAESVTEDSSMPVGERRVVQKAVTGYRYSVYKIVYENDKEIEKVRINNSYYVPVRGEVRVGTMKVDSAAADAPAESTPPDDVPAEPTPPPTDAPPVARQPIMSE